MIGHRLYFLASILFIMLIGYYDIQTGAHVSMMLLYAIPILMSSWFCGKSEGLVVAFAATAIWVIVNMLHPSPGESDAILSWNAFTRLGIFVLIAYSISLQAQLRKTLEKEKLLSSSDRLTGLFNKWAFRERVEVEIDRARRYNHPISLAFIDLDNFKHVNDTQGHASGDKLLQHVGATIKQAIRMTDIAGRVGGDEFAVFFPETNEEQVRKATEKLINALEKITNMSGWQVTASIGVLTCKDNGDSYDALLGRADKLMYVAKEKGKNVAEFMVI